MLKKEKQVPIRGGVLVKDPLAPGSPSMLVKRELPDENATPAPLPLMGEPPQEAGQLRGSAMQRG